MGDFRERFRAFIEKVYIPSNADKSTVSGKWDEIYRALLPNIPEKLFRYRCVTEYSINDFQNGTISLCHARVFPDKYDSYVYIDQDVIQRGLLGSLKEAYQFYLLNVINGSPLVQNKRKADEVREYLKNGYNFDQITEIVINRDYPDYINNVKSYMKKQEARFRSPRNSAKIACFTESVQSKFMWDAYADGYKGFALEYDFRSLKNGRKDIHDLELFPMIYADERPDATNDETFVYMHEYVKNMAPSPFKMSIEEFEKRFSMNQLYWFTSYLYKDKKEYQHEHEWRLLYYNFDNEEDYYSIPDNNSLKAIYYGPDITDDNREKLHKIAQEKGIAEYNVSLDVDSRKYDLKIISIREKIIGSLIRF